MTPGILYLVATPIGNLEDISQRALRVLKEVDYVICEEYKVGQRLLKQLGVEAELLQLNEHNERDSQITELLLPLKEGKSMALISDGGTPVFADPGTLLVQAAVAAEIQVTPVPGASSLMSALVCSGFDIKQFYFLGFLPRQTEKRQARLQQLKNFTDTLVVYEAPYRLQPVLTDLAEILGKKRPAVVCLKLTTEEEHFQRGSLRSLQRHFQANPIKAEFVIIIEGKKPPKRKASNKPKNLHRRRR